MTDDLFSVADQVTIVSGGSRGIGKALAAGFAGRGARVIVTGREEATLSRSAAEISIGRHPVVPIVCDVAQLEDIERLVASALEKFGRIDTLVNVAGVNKRKKVETFTPDEYDFILNIRDELKRGETLGPQMITTGAILDGNPPLIPTISLGVQTPEQGREAVRQQVEAGADMIKAYSRLDKNYTLCDLSLEKPACQLGGSNTNWITNLAFNHSGSQLATLSTDGALRLWDANGKPAGSLPAPEGRNQTKKAINEPSANFGGDAQRCVHPGVRWTS